MNLCLEGLCQIKKEKHCLFCFFACLVCFFKVDLVRHCNVPVRVDFQLQPRK